MSEAVVQPPVLRWAQRRGGHDDGAMRNRFGNWDQWLTREKTPHFSDIARIAHFTRVPLGYLFLPEPPQEDLPIPDLRSGRGSAPAASDELLDTIYLNQRRQAWYEDHLAEVGDLAEVGAAVPPLPFVAPPATLVLKKRRAGSSMLSTTEFILAVPWAPRSGLVPILLRPSKISAVSSSSTPWLRTTLIVPLILASSAVSPSIPRPRRSSSSMARTPNVVRSSPSSTNSRMCGAVSPR